MHALPCPNYCSRTQYGAIKVFQKVFLAVTLFRTTNVARLSQNIGPVRLIGTRIGMRCNLLDQQQVVLRIRGRIGQGREWIGLEENVPRVHDKCPSRAFLASLQPLATHFKTAPLEFELFESFRALATNITTAFTGIHNTGIAVNKRGNVVRDIHGFEVFFFGGRNVLVYAQNNVSVVSILTQRPDEQSKGGHVPWIGRQSHNGIVTGRVGLVS
mmetsp:Transcript_6719/g.13341  ORF Transcript_6719/g.13341 Transcript_6719/m.13341 type:complete len:214 (-) Transcript_6719:119-760(-)|eukprot:scaffold1565_cov221-Amphora_coffeaeformis.AAC.7